MAMINRVGNLDNAETRMRFSRWTGGRAGMIPPHAERDEHVLSELRDYESVANLHSAPTIALETTNCPLCGSNRRRLVVAAADREALPPQPLFAVVRCRECDLCYTNPRPREADMGRFYYDNYAPHQAPHAPPKTARARSRRSAFIGKRRPNWLRGEIEPIGQRRLLDFGCGTGAFLQCMDNLGWQVVGVDASPRAVKYVLEELKLPALAGTLPNAVLPPESFDLVTLWHSLEHVYRPLEVLGEVHNLLSSGGKVLVAVPNIQSAPFRWFGPAWYGLDLPRHLTHFTPATLRKMLERTGFEVEAVQMLRHSHWLRQSAELASRGGTIALPLRLLKFRLPSSVASKLYLLAGQSDSFAVIARKKRNA
jgi:2-polyprenyl-3-methyl-5-hydroxy-6-metoxy-1,4-benzoquinol methylase